MFWPLEDTSKNGAVRMRDSAHKALKCVLCSVSFELFSNSTAQYFDKGEAQYLQYRLTTK